MTFRPLWLASLAARTVLVVAVRVPDALAVALCTAVLATTLTTFSPFLSALADRRERRNG